MVNKPNETLTIFRKFKEGDIIALFPEIKGDDEGLFCMSYQHIGQHGLADYNIVTYGITKKAKPEEYQELKEELESIGYILDIKQKWNRRRS